MMPRLCSSLVRSRQVNQLTDESVTADLAGHGVVWIPDYVASAGGIIYALSRESENYGHEAARKRVEGIGDTVSRLLDLARSTGVTPLRAAQRIAGARLGSTAPWRPGAQLPRHRRPPSHRADRVARHVLGQQPSGEFRSGEDALVDVPAELERWLVGGRGRDAVRTQPRVEPLGQRQPAHADRRTVLPGGVESAGDRVRVVRVVRDLDAHEEQGILAGG
ncbi:MAG: hypothetical protein JF597_43045 [Streptomyces sp.]|uniref:hypothetical protein n=1 Tax=Streptomyces sp. TaxID=1931 RepID=UPI0025E6BA50|nr:hypothetical protein [Streptomyces sp.]MBW8800125.1 hypothetical protein [Streptomyces sp.]